MTELAAPPGQASAGGVDRIGHWVGGRRVAGASGAAARCGTRPRSPPRARRSRVARRVPRAPHRADVRDPRARARAARVDRAPPQRQARQGGLRRTRRGRGRPRGGGARVRDPDADPGALLGAGLDGCRRVLDPRLRRGRCSPRVAETASPPGAGRSTGIRTSDGGWPTWAAVERLRGWLDHPLRRMACEKRRRRMALPPMSFRARRGRSGSGERTGGVSMQAIRPARWQKGDVEESARLGGLAHFIARHRWPVIGMWIVLTLFGGFAAGQLSTRWYQSLAVPGKPAYEASQRTLKALRRRRPRTERRRLPHERRRDEEQRRSSRRCSAPRPPCRARARARTSRPAT